MCVLSHILRAQGRLAKVSSRISPTSFAKGFIQVGGWYYGNFTFDRERERERERVSE